MVPRQATTFLIQHRVVKFMPSCGFGINLTLKLCGSGREEEFRPYNLISVSDGRLSSWHRITGCRSAARVSTFSDIKFRGNLRQDKRFFNLCFKGIVDHRPVQFSKLDHSRSVTKRRVEE
ncbi:hypothetical protein NPIL_288471 [Nephila pilipes]|uniref:Uncharacterized protein n=1 Tax=Nephila pilipes TaxID=299642 RepID=A0A8X6P896_NEPPI|nr:hypothetical protein NPIL_288471 [Nephila pilipes]